MEQTEQPQAPVIQIAGGNPTDEEVAAVTAVLAAATAAAPLVEPRDDRPIAGGWRSNHRQLRRVVPPGREAWKYSARP